MGYAKYREDDLGIYDDRMYLRNTSTSNIFSNSIRSISNQEDKFFCPFCKCGYKTYKNLIDHILVSHGGSHEFVYLNNRKIIGAEQTVKQVFSLMLYSFREDTREIRLLDGMGNIYSFRTQAEKFDYDIYSILKTKLYSEIQIENIEVPVLIKQQLDIRTVSIDKIISGKYSSYLFDEQLSDGKLNLDDCLIYIKMLIHEGTETDSFIEYISQMHFDKTRELQEIYYYHFLSTGSTNGIVGKLSADITATLGNLLDGEYQKAESILSGMQTRSNVKYGCQLMLGLLKNNKMAVDYYTKKYEPFGIIGILEKILYHYATYEKARPDLLLHEFEEIRLFIKYPLIKALVELHDSINHSGVLSHESYSLLRDLTPLAAIHYCFNIDDPVVKEKILKSMMKSHKDSILLKEYAFQNDYEWMKHKIFVSDRTLYKKAVLKQNEALGNVFSLRFIENFPFDDKIQIMPLGGEHEIGASCFVISYKGYNIMIDCGINVQKYGDEAYPALDLCGKEIDTIIISHAHIDHSGAIPKAHAMWPDANIIATAPTKVFLKYLYSDMAKVKNGITDEFEIENVKIEKSVMLDTLNVMNTLNFEEWVYLNKEIKIRLHPAGHIIGAAMVELVIAGKVLLYTGDYCNHNQVLTGNYDLNSLPQNVDYLITESTYLKKNKVDWSRQCDDLKRAILSAIHGKHAILLPAASIGRSQELVCLVGEMKLSGELPKSIPLYIAGMAIPATTQIVPLMNDRYEKIIGLFKEFDGQLYPEGNAIVIASSGSMSRGSASYRIAKFWDAQRINYTIIANGYLEEDSEADNGYMNHCINVQRLSLSTHADLKGIFDLIDYVSPKVISFVHRGSALKSDVDALVNTCKSHFSNDILYRDLKVNRCDRIFDMYEWFMEGVSDHD